MLIVLATQNLDATTGGPLIVLKNGSIFLAKPYYENNNEIAVLWEELHNLLNKKKPYYREIRTMRVRTMRGLPVLATVLYLYSICWMTSIHLNWCCSASKCWMTSIDRCQLTKIFMLSQMVYIHTYNSIISIF